MLIYFLRRDDVRIFGICVAGQNCRVKSSRKLTVRTHEVTVQRLSVDIAVVTLNLPVCTLKSLYSISIALSLISLYCFVPPLQTIYLETRACISAQNVKSFLA